MTAQHLKKRFQKGFTLIELLVVISIISLLSSIVLASLGSARTRAKNIAFTRELFALRDALALYRLDNNGDLPSSGAWYVTDNALNGGTIISILDPILVGGGYISEIPHHPDWPGNRDEITVGYAYDAPSSGVNYFFSCSGTNDPQEIIQDNGVLFVISSNPDITLDAFQNELGMYTGFDPNTVYSGNNYLASYHGGSAQIYCLPL